MNKKNIDYESFVEKFCYKKTTDDCYTPDDIYEAVRQWATEEYNLEGREIVRPFYPGGDYEHYSYPDSCVVLDNPPFSFLAKILNEYDRRHVDYFLFCPSLTSFEYLRKNPRRCIIFVDGKIRYTNGAQVKTAFITNLESANIARTAPILNNQLNRILHVKHKKRYVYPPEMITASKIIYIADYDFAIPFSSARHISYAYDVNGDKIYIYGSGLLSDMDVSQELSSLHDKRLDDNAKYCNNQLIKLVYPSID